ncbi:hypothetical protein M097_0902 [Phocaeicola vulgatus str. 3775 SL(B) 10 (iv)]|uniref:Uncharacterized protein n=1 Tax=Phocaeicola vulgatus str. 3775 SL(B) 10 (iv) TaxID=1339350 RepID=A0A078RBM1_PHOVU|nr:hypothetical protein M098_2625 [Phocaeicola vulgatus str. 3775 SR(B) 19]KDS32700.1 hypothetical protein M097_0902 [Phocaeicola vulgatus str. 3775 SL(B) 10 (iv)]DAU97379.1 MAG TPA: hypothetical protein [Caudoviricetes sp.]
MTDDETDRQPSANPLQCDYYCFNLYREQEIAAAMPLVPSCQMYRIRQ